MNTAAKRIMPPVVRPILWVHHRLLPQTSYVGWLPYLWLPWFTYFYLPYSTTPPGALRWTIYAIAGVVFLALYFRAYHASARDSKRELGWIIVAMTAMGCGFMWPDGNGMVFFVYAACFCGSLGPVKKSAAALVLVVAAFAISAAVIHLNGYTFMVGAFLTIILGIGNIYFEVIGEKNRALKLSQEEIRKLATSAERERIARDLHDLLGHTLTFITVKAQLAATLAERDLAGAAREIRDVERISRDALAQVREAVGGYHSGGLLGELANARVALTAANVRLAEKVEPPRLSPAQDSVLAMVMREAVTNVVRHSGAQHCRIEFANGGADVRLLIEDDGHGGALEEGNGLKGMRDRLQTLSGRLEIASSRNGTRLAILVPLHPAAQKPGCAAAPA